MLYEQASAFAVVAVDDVAVVERYSSVQYFTPLLIILVHVVVKQQLTGHLWLVG